MILLGAVPSALQALYFLFAYESPRYLLKVNKEKEAFRSLKNFRRDEGLAQIEFERMKMHVKDQEKESEKIGNAGVLDVIKRIWSDRPLRRAVVLGCTLQLIQQLAGINTIMSGEFDSKIFQLPLNNSNLYFCSIWQVLLGYDHFASRSRRRFTGHMVLLPCWLG